MKGEVQRLKTYIPGLDRLIEGGIPKGATVLITGAAGCGKTILGLQFLAGGAMGGEKGLYVSFENNREDIILQAAQFGWDFEKLEREGKLKVMNFNMSTSPVLNVIMEIENEVRKNDYERIVLDSISVLSIFASVMAGAEMLESIGVRVEKAGIPSGETVLRGAVMGIIGRIKNLRKTALILSELSEGGHYMSRDTVSEFVCDGIIKLTHLRSGKRRKRYLEVVKMRETAHDERVHELRIGKGGIEVK